MISPSRKMACRRPSALSSFSGCKPRPIRRSRHQQPSPVVPTAPPATQMQIAPEPPGDTRYRDHRLLALYFDMSTMQPADQLRAFDAALKFIDTQMDPSDLMAVMTFEGGAVRVRQDFTGDRAQIRKRDEQARRRPEPGIRRDDE